MDREDIKFIIKFLIGLVIFICLVNIINEKIDKEKYNNGICKDCGGTYIFQNAVGHQISTSYIYKCEQCNKLIEIDKYY